MDVSPDGNIMIGGCTFFKFGPFVAIARNTVTGAELWRKQIRYFRTASRNRFRIHGDVVVIPQMGEKTLVLDITNGHTVLTLPSIQTCFCVLDGLTRHHDKQLSCIRKVARWPVCLMGMDELSR